MHHLSLAFTGALAGLTLSLSTDSVANPADKKPVAAIEHEVAASAAAEGMALFSQRCQVCHSVEPGRNSPLGPSLHEVVGRPAGSAEFRYTPALKNSGITWTREKLNEYLAAPIAAVPGTRMVISLPDEAQRQAVIDYLAENSGA